MKEGDIVFFDFVAKGTTQLYLGRLINRHIKGLYFLQLEKDYMQRKHLDIEAFYENGEEENSVIYQDYYILETILTSDMPSIVGFCEDGKPLYAKETRFPQDIECINKVQKGIIDYFETYIDICPQLDKGINKEVDEIFLKLLHNINISCDEFMNVKVEDPFFNRLTNVADLI